jgi:hypothetical protein
VTANTQRVAAADRPPSGTHRVPSCRAHCASCSRCFCSVDAFDHHRRGRFGLRSKDLKARRCVNILDDPRFEQVPGMCQVSGEKLGTTLWRLATAALRARHRFDNRRRRQAAPSGRTSSMIGVLPSSSGVVIPKSR